MAVGFSTDSDRLLRPVYKLFIEEPASEIVGKEDLMGRFEFEELMTRDPESGFVPSGIRSAEIQFAKKLAEKNDQSRINNLLIASAGPFNVGGRTRAVAFDVRDEDIILAGGVSGGVWKSIDGGESWVRKSDPENRNSVTCIVQDTRPGKEDIWYHGTGELVGNSARGGGAPFRGDGIYKSIDNGETWFPLVATQDAEPNVFNSQFQYIWNIVVNSQNLIEDEVLVAAYGGILRSTDGGNSWGVVLGQQLFGLADDVDLNDSNASFYTDLTQAENGMFYATMSTESSSDEDSADAGIYVSSDGNNWIDLAPFTPESQYRRIVIGNSKSNPEISYFLVDSNPLYILHLTLTSDGSTLTPVFEERLVPDFEENLGAFNTQGSYNMMIKVHPENPDIVFVGGTNLYRTTDGFKRKGNITWVGGYEPDGGGGIYPNHHPDQHDLLFYPSNPSRILSASDGGLIVSEDGLADSVMWKSINNGFITAQFFTIAQSKIAGDPTLIGGMQDNGTDITNSTGIANWQEIISGDGSYVASTNDNALWFASFQRGQALRLTLNTSNEITSFGRIDPGGLVSKAGSAYLFINPFILDPNNQNRMFIAGGNHLYFNSNVSQIPGGTQKPTSVGWLQVTSSALSGGVYSALDIAFNSSVLYAGTSNGQLIKVLNADDQFSFQVEELTPFNFPEGGYISSIAINPENENHLVVIFSNYNVPSIFESFDGGSTFTDISGNLEQNVDGTGNGPSIRWAEIIPTNTGLLYMIGTSVGLFSSTETLGNATVWVKESRDLIGSAIITMMDYRMEDGRLAIATHGNGVFTANITDFEVVLNEAVFPPFTLTYTAPNPFAEVVKIGYNLPKDGIVRIDVLSGKGEVINNLLWAPQFAGSNEITWDGTNASGISLPNGVYFYRIQYDGKTKTERVLLRR